MALPSCKKGNAYPNRKRKTLPPISPILETYLSSPLLKGKGKMMTTKWLPSREGTAYSRLYLFFRNRSFSLDDAGSILAEKSYANVRKILSNLVGSGWAERPGRGEYKLRPIEEIVGALVFTRPLKHPLEVVKSFGNRHPYAISGVTAACFHSGFLRRCGNIYEIKVLVRDLDEWRSEFEIVGIPVKSGLPSSLERERAKYFVVLKPVYNEKLENVEEVEGLMVESKEKVIVNCLERRAGYDAISNLIINRNKLDYEKLAENAMRYGLVKVIGALMEAINREARRELFNEKIINRFYERSQKYRVKVIFSLKVFEKLEDFEYEKYGDILNKWEIDGVIDPNELRKIVLDSISLSRLNSVSDH